MADITITIPVAAETRVIHALCVDAGVEESAPNTKAYIIQWMKNTVKHIELREAQEAEGSSHIDPELV